MPAVRRRHSVFAAYYYTTFFGKSKCLQKQTGNRNRSGRTPHGHPAARTSFRCLLGMQKWSARSSAALIDPKGGRSQRCLTAPAQ